AMYAELGGILSMTGVAIFALGCHTIIPDIYRGIGDYRKTRNVVILAFLIPTIIYAIFMISFLLVFGRDTPQIATQGLEILYGRLGKIVGNIIPLLAITTSYIGIGLAQQSNSKEFLKLKKSIAWSLTTIPPLVVYLAGIKNFADVLAFAGDTGDMMAFIILPLVMLVIRRYRETKVY
ncbi:MAG: amino acid permease, partial [Thermoplasmata archaeon]|nr:amino acid permease [Thermoplasmata archaeon]